MRLEAAAVSLRLLSEEVKLCLVIPTFVGGGVSKSPLFLQHASMTRWKVFISGRRLETFSQNHFPTFSVANSVYSLCIRPDNLCSVMMSVSVCVYSAVVIISNEVRQSIPERTAAEHTHTHTHQSTGSTSWSRQARKVCTCRMIACSPTKPHVFLLLFL